MKPVVLTLFTIFTSCLKGVAQKSEGLAFIKDAETYSASFASKSYYSHDNIPFRSIEVLDYRYDSSKIGYVEAALLGKKYYRIVPESGWADNLTRYFEKNLDLSADYTLAIVIRNYWMQEGFIEKITDKKVITRQSGPGNEGGTCTAGIDVYAKKDSLYQPLFKIDYDFLNFYNFKIARLEEWYFLPFDSMAKMLKAYNLEKAFTTRRKIYETEIRSFYTERLNNAAMIEYPTQKGIYLSFDDLKNNKILTTDFKVENGKVTDELYLIDGDSKQILTDFWGCFDGKTFFIKSGYNIFPALQQQNTFEVYGNKYISNVYSQYNSPDITITSSRMKIDKKILQINMETGSFF